MIPTKVSTPIPGPNSQAMVARMQKLIPYAEYSGLFGVALESGSGAYLTDVDGNVFLDFLAGASAVSLGYGRQDVIDAYVRTAGRIQHSAFGYSPTQEALDLAQKLIDITPGDHAKQVLFGLSGSDSVDAAIKIARRYTGKPRIISFRGGYHGSTGFSISANGFGSLQKGLFLGENHSMLKFPSTPVEAEETLEAVEQLMKAGDVAGVVTEPIQGDGGNVEPPQDFHQNLSALAHRYGAIYAVDEVQSGVGRSGCWWEIETFGVVPDILCTAKAISSGYIPLSACIARQEMAASLGKAQHLFTFSGHPPACAVGLKVLEVIEKEDLRRNAEERGIQLRRGLQSLVDRYPSARQVRGRGLHVGFEVRDGKSNQALGGLFAFRCVEKGLYPGYFGESNNVVRLHPPLIVTAEDVQFAIGVLTDVVEEWETGRFPQETVMSYSRNSVGLGDN
ncbi:MAG: aspartate aminotransferase family protein [Chloroflexi bacterium]|nr:aspartate aminotransferase family protein [Chloroflexota bacterium]